MKDDQKDKIVYIGYYLMVSITIGLMFYVGFILLGSTISYVAYSMISDDLYNENKKKIGYFTHIKNNFTFTKEYRSDNKKTHLYGTSITAIVLGVLNALLVIGGGIYNM
jgi:hypothetical protein